MVTESAESVNPTNGVMVWRRWDMASRRLLLRQVLWKWEQAKMWSPKGSKGLPQGEVVFRRVGGWEDGKVEGALKGNVVCIVVYAVVFMLMGVTCCVGPVTSREK